MNYFNFSSRIPKTVTKFFVTTLLVVSLFFSDASLANAGPLDDLAAQIGQGLVDQLVGTVGSTLATNLVNITGVSQAANLIGAQSINAIGDIIISGGVDGLANAAVSAGGQAINTVLSDIGAVNGVMLFQNVQSDIMSNIGSIFTSGADPASFANGIINTGVQEFSNFVNDLGLTQATNFLGTIDNSIMDNLGSVIFSGGGIQDMVGGIVNADGTQFGGLLNGLGLTQSIDFLNNVDSNIIGNISQVFAAGGGVGNIVGGILNSGAIDFGGMLSSLGLDQATSFLSTLDAGIIGNIGQIFLSGGGVENIIGGVLSGGAIDFGGMLSSLGLGEATNFLNGLGGDFINNIGGILSGGGVSDIISGVLGSDGFNFGGLLGGLGLDGAADFLGNITGGIGGNILGSLGSIFGAGGGFDGLLSTAQDIGAGILGDFMGNLNGSSILTSFLGGSPIGGLTSVLSDGLANGIGMDAIAGVFNGVGGEAVAQFVNQAGVGALTQGILSGGVGGAIGMIGGLLGGLGGGGGPCSPPVAFGLPGVPTGVPTGSFFPFGLHVPVHDQAVANNTAFTVANTNAIIGNTFAGNLNTTKIIINTSNAQFYLHELCIKEYKTDPDIQHQWRATIGAFTDYVVKFISGAYGGNPMWVSNPYLYYQIVDDEIYGAFIEEIMATDLEYPVKVKLVKYIETQRTDRIFPELVQPTLPISVNNELAQEWDWEKFNRLAAQPFNNFGDLSALVQSEIEGRRSNAREIEAEKLSWGQGFFGMEHCIYGDRALFIAGVKDRRNCRIVTPGSIIKEQTGLVLGSAIRQMELADELDEWVSAAAFNGLRGVFGEAGLLKRPDLGTPTAVAKPPVQSTDGSIQIPTLGQEGPSDPYDYPAIMRRNLDAERAASIYGDLSPDDFYGTDEFFGF